MNPDIIIAIAVPSMFAWFAWMIFSTIRRFKIATLQSEVQTKPLDKVGSAQDRLAYAQTDAGREMLESLKVPWNRLARVPCSVTPSNRQESATILSKLHSRSFRR